MEKVLKKNIYQNDIFFVFYCHKILNCTISGFLHSGLFSGSNVTFVLINNLMTWTEAQTYCRTHHTDLTSVRNIIENQKVAAQVPSGDKAWIGLFRDAWKWTDGRDSSFKYWSHMQPNHNVWNEDCAMANFGNSGKWEDWPCDLKIAFICYSGKSCFS